MKREYLEQTRNHESILLRVLATMGLDSQKETTGRLAVRRIGETLVGAMEMARRTRRTSTSTERRDGAASST